MRFTVLRREEDDPKVAGMFIEDGDGSIYAAHSGDFDAKAKDPHLFKKNTEKDDNWVEVEGQDKRWYLFTPLDRGIGDAEVLSNVARFVRDRFEPRHETSQQIGKQPLTRESKRRTSLNTILYGPPGTGKTWKTLKRCVEICDGQAGDNYHERYRELIESERRVEFVTFHQTYGYEEFVEGLRPEPSTEGTGFKLVAKPGVLKRLAERARGDSENKPHVLVIDEINRANISKVMGELITLLEEDKREGAENEVKVTLPHSDEAFTLPANLHILGTMNTADRSIALIDTALRRRFVFEEMPPHPGVLNAVDGINLRAVLVAMNERLEYLIDRDHLIGHAWLMGAKTKADVDEIMRRKIIPLIAEYFYNDWAKVCAVLGGTNSGFVQQEVVPPPDLDGVDKDERFRWTMRKKFDVEAYESLVSGKTTT